MNLAKTWVGMRDDLVANDYAFKIGRTEKSSATPDALAARYAGEYPNEKVVGARVVIDGSREHIIAAEKALIQIAWHEFPGRCINEQIGGGPAGAEEQHSLYLITFSKSPQLINQAWENTFFRLMSE